MEDVDEYAIKYFKKKSIEKGRLSKEELDLPLDKLLMNLELYDGKYLNFAGVLLFSVNPEKWVLNSCVKIGFFANNNADLIFQDEVGGPLVLQVDKVMKLIYDKYLKALIRYEGIQRIEEFVFPYDAFRELLLNSIIHKSYETRNTIQISVYEDKIYIANECLFSKDVLEMNFFEKHISRPYNPLISKTFYKMGFIENWGRGYETIISECKRVGNPLPKIKRDSSSIMIECEPSEKFLKSLKELKEKTVIFNYEGINDTINDTIKLTKTEKEILKIVKENSNVTYEQLSEILGLSRMTVARNISNLKNYGYVKRIGHSLKFIERDTNDTVNGINDTVNGTNDTEKITDVELLILEIIRKNPNVTYNQIFEKLGLARKTIARCISDLKKKGYIERVGSDKSGYYKLNK